MSTPNQMSRSEAIQQITWICFECSNPEQEDILICEDCPDKFHEEHYIEEILY